MCISLYVTFLALIGSTFAAKILIMAPTPSISHQLPFHIVTKALLQRGHRITFMTTDSVKISHENYTEIDMSSAYQVMRAQDFIKMCEQSPIESVLMFRDFAQPVMEMQLNDSAVQSFIRSGETFDLVIVERLGYMGYYGLIHKMGAPPVIGFVTLSPPASVYYSYGNPMNPAYMPEMWLGLSDHMNFWERLYNALFYLRLMYLWFGELLPAQEKFMRERFGTDLPPLYEIDRNFSLLIINNHFTMEYPRPHLPNIIEITGIHVATEQKPLPKNIQQFLDEAEYGVIYFSLGSNVRSDSLPEWKRRAFMDAFRELPQRVLWKWENDSLHDQSDNLMASKWLPQQDVLAHPNVRLFIMQGGLQSLNEATYHAVPLVVIPFFSDQAHNAAKIRQAEIGVWLEYRDVTKESVLRDVRTVLNNSKYRENMKRLSEIFKEHKADSVERAVWWIEYVIRHNGAPHLRSGALDLYWWQLLLLDVVGFVLLLTIAALITLYLLVARVIRVLGSWRVKIKTQ